MMVQYVIDCLSRNTAPPWLESADPAVSFTFAGGEKAHSETRLWLPLPGTRHERFAVHIVPSEVTPILLSLDMLREFGLVLNADSAHCYNTKLRCRIPVTVFPSGHLALALTPSGSFETTVETKTLVKETAADMTAAVQEDFMEKGQRSIVACEERYDGNTKQVPRLPGSVIRDLTAAARQMDETMVSAFTAACSFRRLDLALVNPGTVQTILLDDVTAAGGTAEEWSDGDLTTVRGAQKLRDWIVMKSPRIVWFCCPTENSTPSENDHLTAAPSRSRHQSREHRIQRHMSNLAADMASSGQCDFVLEIPWNSRAVLFGGFIHERLKGFHCAWVPACAWGLRNGSIGYAEGGWRVVTSMRSVADLIVSRSCNETHWHRPVECTSPPAASLSHLCRRLISICSSTSSSDGTCGTGYRSHHQTTTSEETDNSETPHQETAIVW